MWRYLTLGELKKRKREILFSAGTFATLFVMLWVTVVVLRFLLGAFNEALGGAAVQGEDILKFDIEAAEEL